MIYEKVLDEEQRLNKQIQSLQIQLEQLPEGKLISTKNGTRNKWIWSDGHKQVYLPKKQRQLAEQLAYKKYLSLQLKTLLNEKTAVDFYLRHHDSNCYEAEQSLINSPQYKELLKPFFIPLSEELNEWVNAPYEQSQKHPEGLIYNTLTGNRVRSKSEVMIDMLLFKNKIPFRYECLLQLGDISVFPDFTIRHPKTGETFYWEHFGMMDNPTYCKNTHIKLQNYTAYGIIPSIQLITTYETKEHPLMPDMVEQIIQYYFLN